MLVNHLNKYLKNLMKYTSFNIFSEAYEKVLDEVFNRPQYISSPRGLECKEILDLGFSIQDPYACLYLNPVRSSQFKYIAGELLWYLAKDRKTDFIHNYSKFWKSLVDKEGNINSNYGYLITENNQNGVNSWQWAIQSLIKDKDTRQAIIFFNKPNYQKDTKDFPCTIYGNFHIRDNKLNLSIKMRSNDLILGMPTDVAFFCFLQICAYNLLLKYYPDLQLGSYTHHADSAHIYANKYEIVDKMLQSKFTNARLPLMNEIIFDETGEVDLNLKLFIKYFYEKLETPSVESFNTIFMALIRYFLNQEK